MDREDTRLVNFLRTYKPLAPEPREDCEVRLLYLIGQHPHRSLGRWRWLGLVALAIAGVWLTPRLQLQVAEVLTEQERQEIISELLHDLSLPELPDGSGLWLDSPVEL